MKDCDLLVVVGYGGGEEGIMALLQDAGRVMPNIVIYWVTHKPGIEGLTDNARRLLSGENKFMVWGGTADLARDRAGADEGSLRVDLRR